MPALTRYSNRELLSLPDCEGLLESGRCKWLKKTACTGAGCSIHNRVNSLERAYARLRALDEETQEHIARKYYFGERPWRESDE